MQVGHHGLVHGAVPLNVPGASETVPVHVLVVLMVDRCLSGAPLAVSIGSGGCLGKHTGDGPVGEVWVVDQSLGVEAMVVHDEGTVVAETTADTTHNEPADPTVGQPAPHIEVLDGELTDDGQTEQDSELSARRVVRPVEVGLVGRAHDHVEISSREPALKDVDIMEGLRGPLKLTLLKNVLTNTEANELAILNVVRELRVHSSSCSIIKGILTAEITKKGQSSCSKACSIQIKCMDVSLPAQPGLNANRACTCQ